MKDKKNSKITSICIIVTFLVLVLGFYIQNSLENAIDKYSYTSKSYNSTFKIISSQENENLEKIVKDYARKKGYDVEIEYAGTLDIIQKINNGEQYDGVWLSNSIWGYMLNGTSLSNSKCTSINPVIFGIKKSKADELGFVGKTVYTRDIVKAIAEGKLKFSMSNPTVTNSGASAYLGMLSTLAGNPEVLTKEILENETLKHNLKVLFSGMERSSGDEDFLEELFLNGNYEAVVTYESSIININKQLEARGEEVLYAIYPVDGVSISDSPFGYIDRKDAKKKEIFTDIQSYLLSNEGQKLLQEKGKRTWYGGISENVDKTVFNPDWGIDTSKYISPIKYPSKDVIKLALNLYQNELRKPVHVVFCLDYSGSMRGTGEEQLKAAMNYILTDEAANDFIQFASGDKIDVIPFASSSQPAWSTTDGTKTEDILNKINAYPASGNTALYKAAEDALDLLKNEDMEKYNLSIILMTDGEANVGTYYELYSKYTSIKKQIPIYSIMFGNAVKSELQQIANMSNAKVFDGKTDLVKAFKEVRGYN